ncbi:hypothetical protein [Arthrobacter sp. KBS0703]|nr:hypothetical protein [Arthrobacter sp. KBS0703]
MLRLEARRLLAPGRAGARQGGHAGGEADQSGGCLLYTSRCV